jgi:hypothetical protein
VGSNGVFNFDIVAGFFQRHFPFKFRGRLGSAKLFVIDPREHLTDFDMITDLDFDRDYRPRLFCGYQRLIQVENMGWMDVCYTAIRLDRASDRGGRE